MFIQQFFPRCLNWSEALSITQKMSDRVFTRSSKRPANFQQMYSKYTWIAERLLDRVNTPLFICVVRKLNCRSINRWHLWLCVYSVVEVKAHSHQGLPLTYELTTDAGLQSTELAIDPSTGIVDLLRPLDYEKDPHQYHLKVKVVENGRPARSSMVNVCISTSVNTAAISDY